MRPTGGLGCVPEGGGGRGHRAGSLHLGGVGVMKDSENRPGRERGSGQAPGRQSRSFADSPRRGGRGDPGFLLFPAAWPGSPSRWESRGQARGRSPGWAPNHLRLTLCSLLPRTSCLRGLLLQTGLRRAQHRAWPARPPSALLGHRLTTGPRECGAARGRPEEVPRCSLTSGSSDVPSPPHPPAGPRLTPCRTSHQLTRHELNQKAVPLPLVESSLQQSPRARRQS